MKDMSAMHRATRGGMRTPSDPNDARENFRAFLADGPAATRAPLYAGTEYPARHIRLLALWERRTAETHQGQE